MSNPRRYTIERAENGFITHPAEWALGGTFIYRTLDEVMAEILEYYEHRTPNGAGGTCGNYGVVTIVRERPSALDATEPTKGEA